uniref:RRM domain-containing protein n=1 Tax=Anopheles atroparvus TaxID=41427 RepID=A0AAG5D0I0_ANOAO
MSIALRIFNFPPILTNLDVREFLHLFGLQATRLFRRRACHGAIVNVANESEARLVISRLHQLLIQSHRIKVEYSEKEPSVDESSSSIFDTKVPIKRKTVDRIEEGRATLTYEGFPPPHLMYRYPKHSPTILHNISSQLASNASFYYQVLHLMNKMSLKAPFESSQPEKSATSCEPVNSSPQPCSDEESELESDDGINGSKRTKLNHNLRSVPRTMKVVHYDQSLPRTQNVGRPYSQKSNIEIHISGDSLNTANSPNGALNLAAAIKPIGSKPEEPISITLADILGNRVPDEQRRTLNVFQNYTPGDPTNKLYIKNLAKTVTEQDLHNIVHLFVEKDAFCDINVKLMKTGRMKGQAFISFLPADGAASIANEKLKQCVARALSTINGYILKDKPMVVSYAKSS